MDINLTQSEMIKLSFIEPNNGQIEGLPKNPRFIKNDKYKKLVKSLQDHPQMLAGKFKTTVWDIPKPLKNDLHPTMKPIELVCECLLDCSIIGDSVIDMFGGSGTTLIACEQLKRKCFMMEYDPHYCDVIIARWEKLTGKKAVKIA